MPEKAGEDPLAVRSPPLFRLFGYYLHWYFWRHFEAVRIARVGLPEASEGRAMIVCANHPSWWDPALFILLNNRLLPNRAGYGPMDAASLVRYPIMRRMGVFGIEPDTARGAARFLEVGSRVLRNPSSVLWITAEGAFTDPRRRPIRLRSGFAHLARRVPGAVILPMAVEYPFWNERKPEALARFGRPIEAGRGRGVADWTALLEGELAATMDALATDSASRDPGRFITLVDGTLGLSSLSRLMRAAPSGDSRGPPPRAPLLSPDDVAE